MPPPGSSMFSMPEAPGALASLFEILLAGGEIGEADEFRVALFGDMQVMHRIGAAHVERIRRALGAHQPEAGEKFLRHIEVGRTQAPIRHILDFDPGHVGPSIFLGTT